jgi:hypothetical protein
MSLGNNNIHQQGDIPEIVKLPNNRIRVIRRFQKFTREDVDNANLGSLMGDFGAKDTTGEQISGQGYTDCRLISVEVDNRFEKQTNADNPVLVKTYETLTDDFVEITDPTITTNEDGLKQVKKIYRAKSGATSTNTVGTTQLTPTDTTIILYNSELQDNTAFAELTEVYLETGLLSSITEEAPSEFANVIKITNISTGLAPIVPDGLLIASRDEDSSGFKTYTRTTLKNMADGGTANDLTGVTSEYVDVVEVETIGSVVLKKITVISGDIAIPDYTPPRIKQVNANVKTEISTTVPDTFTEQIAFNLGDASCSVVSVKSAETNSSGNTVSSTTGVFTFSATGWNRNVNNTARIQNYDGSYFSLGSDSSGTPYTNPVTGSVSYQSFSSPYLKDGGGLEYETGYAAETTKLLAAGASSIPSSYKEYGLIKRNVRHILTSVDGTKYYEITSYTVPNPSPPST